MSKAKPSVRRRPHRITMPPAMTYDEYNERMTAYEESVRQLGNQIHTTSPMHPVKLMLKNLVVDLKVVPEPVLRRYLHRRHEQLFGSKVSGG